VSGIETSYRNCTCGELRGEDEGREVRLCGWVARRRDHGGLIFLDLRDRYGFTQVVIDPAGMEGAEATARAIRLDYVIQVEGRVARRPEGMINPSLETGEIEVRCREVRVLSASKATPFQIEGPIEASEDIRLTYRYLDLRRPDLQRNLGLKSRLMKIARDHLDARSFYEIETPILTRRTPEGARDYLVPSRIHPGKFYALPQSPQIYKQLLMFAGLDRYYQIARCFRDEDLRADRQPEFTQIDIEMSFVDEADIRAVTEGLFVEMTAGVRGVEPERPFPVLTHREAMERFGSDRPDTRFGLEIVDFSDCFRETGFAIFRKVLDARGRIRGIVVPGGAGASRKELGELEATAKKGKGGAGGLIWIRERDGELSSSMGRHVTQAELRAVRIAAEAGPDDLVLLVAGPDPVTSASLDILRRSIGRQKGLIDDDEAAFLWVVDPPLFEISEEDGSLTSSHHPFTAPALDDLGALETDPLSVPARGYDIVLNGVELGSGSIRIHDRRVQEAVFRALGMSAEAYGEKFGFLLESLEYGAPPHGGIALGMDRIAMVFAGVGSLREVVAFPKTTAAQGLMEGSPSDVGDDDLRELHIKKLDNPSAGG
jgi:aspartyl-tRNA synthetase